MPNNDPAYQEILKSFTALRATTSDEDWEKLLAMINGIEKPALPEAALDSRRMATDHRNAAAEADFMRRFPDAVNAYNRKIMSERD